MSETMKAGVEGGTYFVTLTVVGWLDVFIRREYCGSNRPRVRKGM